jgi:hypothetical protein
LLGSKKWQRETCSKKKNSGISAGARALHCTYCPQLSPQIPICSHAPRTDHARSQLTAAASRLVEYSRQWEEGREYTTPLVRHPRWMPCGPVATAPARNQPASGAAAVARFGKAAARGRASKHHRAAVEFPPPRIGGVATRPGTPGRVVHGARAPRRATRGDPSSSPSPPRGARATPPAQCRPCAYAPCLSG